jgi:hypothetical protein
VRKTLTALVNEISVFLFSFSENVNEIPVARLRLQGFGDMGLEDWVGTSGPF